MSCLLSQWLLFQPSSSLPNFLPRWNLSSIGIGPYHSPEEHDLHIAQTYGSYDYFYDSTDEIRFDPENDTLLSCRIHVPEMSLDLSELLDLLVGIPAQRSHIVSRSRSDFNLPFCKQAWIDNKGQFLIVFHPGRSQLSDPQRIQLTQDFDLIIDEVSGAYGWLLSHPVRYIVSGWEVPHKITLLEEESLGYLLAHRMRILTPDFVVSLEDRSPEAYLELESLLNSTRALFPLYQATIIADDIRQIFDMFY